MGIVLIINKWYVKPVCLTLNSGHLTLEFKGKEIVIPYSEIEYIGFLEQKPYPQFLIRFIKTKEKKYNFFTGLSIFGNLSKYQKHLIVIEKLEKEHSFSRDPQKFKSIFHKPIQKPFGCKTYLLKYTNQQNG